MKFTHDDDALHRENEALKAIIQLKARNEQENVRREEYKDIDFGRLLSAATEPQTSVFDILKLMTEGTQRVVGQGIAVALFEMRDIDQTFLEKILYRENTDRTCLVSQDRALYCLIDTELADKIHSLKEIQRYLTLKNGTILGDTERFGEGVVSVAKIEEGEAVKNFHYANYQTGRWQHAGVDLFSEIDPQHSDNVLRVSFPIFYTETERFDEIQYVLLVRNVRGGELSNSMIRSIRGYGNYGTLALALKQLQVKDRQILEKDRFIEAQDRFIVSEVRKYLHNLATPLATMENIVHSLNEMIRDESDGKVAHRYSVLLAQVYKVKDALYRIRQTIKDTGYYQEDRSADVALEEPQADRGFRLCLDDFLTAYLKTVNLEEAYSSRIRFELETGAAQKCILADRTRLAYVLDNAIRNTFQQSEALGIREVVFEIRTVFAPGSNSVVLMLRDYGGGLTNAQYQSFKKHGKIPTTRKSGTGEGIPTIIEILKRLGGQEVDLYNFPLDGILYTASFPVMDSVIS